MPIVDHAIYRDGVRDAPSTSVENTVAELSERGGFAWIGMYRPEEAELDTIARAFDLPALAVEDTLEGHQRPKSETYGDALFVVLRPARYLDGPEEVEFGEVHIFIGPTYAITIRHAEAPDLSLVRSRLEGDHTLLALGPQAVLYAVLDRVVDDYEPVLVGLENDVDEIEDELFQGDPDVSRRIYELLGEAMKFQRATRPLIDMLRSLESDSGVYHLDADLKRQVRDVLDHSIRVVERADMLMATLQNALTVQSTLVSQQQNDHMQSLSEVSVTQGEQAKKISGWAAILFAPALIAAIYGMNFVDMPELRWPLGYPLAILAMIAASTGLYLLFKRRDWL